MTDPDASMATMTYTHEELAEHRRSWAARWESARRRLTALEEQIDGRRADLAGTTGGEIPGDRLLRDLERARQDILGLEYPPLIREADELDAATQRLLSMTRHPAGRKRAKA